MRPLLLLVLLAGCATPQPGRQDLVLTDTQGRVAAWIEPSGKVHYQAKPDAVVAALVKSIANDRATLAEMKKTLEAVEKKAAAQRKAEKRKSLKPVLLKDSGVSP